MIQPELKRKGKKQYLRLWLDVSWLAGTVLLAGTMLCSIFVSAGMNCFAGTRFLFAGTRFLFAGTGMLAPFPLSLTVGPFCHEISFLSAISFLCVIFAGYCQRLRKGFRSLVLLSLVKETES